MNYNVTVVMYHYVRDLANSQYPEIKGLDYKLFQEQIMFLKKHYHIIKMEELIAAINSNHALPPNAALLTFDDAYLDHYTNVFPTLVEHQIQGSFYAPIKAITENQVLDVNKIHFVLASASNKENLVSEIFKQLDIHRQQFCLESNEYYFNKLAVANRMDDKTIIFIKRLLQVELVEELRLLITNHLFRKYVSSDEASFSGSLYMNTSQIKEMHEAGMHFGSHGYNHYWLSKLNPHALQIEIDQSKMFLDGLGVNSESMTMCYPYGDYDENVIRVLKQSGFTLGLTTQVDVANINRDDSFQLPRLDTNDLPKDRDAKPNQWYRIQQKRNPVRISTERY
jgi:peptidoglycan/xylan/chitin deacetylase (PgdA/CDA1 family)